MIQTAPTMILCCPDCRSDQPFEQHHPADPGCPDSLDGRCPEWSCTACGAALLIDFIPCAGETRRLPDIRDRVA